MSATECAERRPYRASALYAASAAELRRLYWDERQTLADLGRRFECDPNSVRFRFRKLGVPTRTRAEAIKISSSFINASQEMELQEQYQTGVCSIELAEQTGWSDKAIRNHLSTVIRTKSAALLVAVDCGRKRTASPRLRRDLFEHDLTADSAWVLGLIYGDGNVCFEEDRGAYTVAVTGSRVVCELVKKIVGVGSEPKYDPRTRTTYCLRWGSKRMALSLRRYHLYGGPKARLLRLPDEVPETMFPHFLRGLWDADGGWFLQPKGQRPVAHLASASAALVEQVQERFGGKIYRSLRTDKKACTLPQYKLTLRVGESAQLKDVLHRDSGPTNRCPRKYLLCHDRNARTSLMKVA